MKVVVNQSSVELAPGTTLAQALLTLNPSAPFAAAINRQFVPKAQYQHTELHEDDQIELISPVVGG